MTWKGVTSKLTAAFIAAAMVLIMVLSASGTAWADDHDHDHDHDHAVEAVTGDVLRLAAADDENPDGQPDEEGYRLGVGQNEGGSVTIKIETQRGQEVMPETENAAPANYTLSLWDQATLTAIPDDGYRFVGWYYGNVGDSGFVETYDPDNSISYIQTEPVLTRTGYRDYDVYAVFEKLIKVTLKGSSIDGGNTAGDYELLVRKGTRWSGVDIDVKQHDIKDHFEEEGYKLFYDYPRVMTKPLTEFGSWEEVVAESNNNDNYTFNEDTTLYVALSKPIDAVELTVEAPKCGEESEVTQNDDIVQVTKSYPKVTADNDEIKPAGVQYSVTPNFSVPGAVWLSDETTALNGTIEGGKPYRAEVAATIAIGYEFVIDEHPGTLTVNGANGDEVFRDENYNGQMPGDWDDVRFVQFTVNAEHDWSDWEVTKEPTNREEGEETRECRHCGEKETRSIPKRDRYELDVGKSEGGTVTITSKSIGGAVVIPETENAAPGNYYLNLWDEATLTAIPADGYRFAGWYYGNIGDSGFVESYGDYIQEEPVLTRTGYRDVGVYALFEKLVKVTLKGSSIDGENTAGDYVLEVRNGTRWYGVDTTEIKQQDITEHFTEEGYKPFNRFPYIMTKPLTEFGSWEEVVRENNNNSGYEFKEDTTLYVALSKPIDAVELTAEAPTCGEVSLVRQFRDREMALISYPRVTADSDGIKPAGREYHFDANYSVPGAVWLSDEATALDGSIEGGKPALAEVAVSASIGYEFDWDKHPETLTVEGANGDEKFRDENYNGRMDGTWNDVRFVQYTIDAEHDWGDWKETKAPGLGVDGEEMRKCRHCDETQTRPIPALHFVTLTLIGTSIDGGHTSELYEIKMVPGSDWSDVGLDNKEGPILEHFTKDGYSLYSEYPRIITKELSEYSDWREVQLENNENVDTVYNEDTTFYVALAKYVDNIELTIDNELCGKESDVSKTILHGTKVNKDYPKVTAHNDQVEPVGKERPHIPDEITDFLHIDSDKTDAAAIWLDENGKPLNGTLEGEKTYTAELGLKPAFGYQFDKNQYNGKSNVPVPTLTVINSNGDAEFREDDYDNNLWTSQNERLIRFTIDAGHDWGDWEETIAPTIDKEGEEKRTCNHCGKEETRPIPKLTFITVTLIGTTVDGYEVSSPYTVRIAKDSTVNEIDKETQKDIVDNFTAGGFVPFMEDLYVMSKPLNSFGSWDEVIAEDGEYGDKKLPDDITLYVPVAKTASAIELKVEKPLCGTEVSYDADDDKNTKGQPQLSAITPGIEYVEVYAPAATLWLDETGEPLNDTIEGGNSYRASARVVSAFGYQFNDKKDFDAIRVIDADKDSESLISYGVDYANITFTVTAEHDWGEWQDTKPYTCTEPGEAERKCKHCDEKDTTITDPPGHDWSAPTYEWKDDNSEVTATRVCKRDGSHIETETVKTVKAEKPATCDEAGKLTFTATFENPAFTIQMKTEDIPATGHDWDEWKVVKEATETQDGEEQRVCKNDPAHKETRTIPAKGHTHSLSHVPAKSPTCTVDGNKEHWICSGCGRYFEDAQGSKEIQREATVIPATGHTPGETVKENVKEPTCEEPGSHDAVVYCEVCGEELARTPAEDPALGHLWGVWKVVTPATETEEGLEKRTCQRDSEHFETRTIPVIGHEHKLVHVDGKPATCTEDGVKEHWICSEGDNACGRYFEDAAGTKEINKEDTVIPAAGHQYGSGGPVIENIADPTCDEPGSHDVVAYCAVCGEEFWRITVPDKALGHIWGNPTYEWKDDNSSVTATRVCGRDEKHVETETVATVPTKTEPTCDKPGEYTYGARFENPAFEMQMRHEPIPALGHDWGEWTLVKAPTESEEGEEERVCKNDAEHKETRKVPATGHVHKMASVPSNEPTCTKEGNKKYYICAECGRYFEDLAGTKEIKREDVVIPALGHKPGAVAKVNVKLPTCEEPGSYDLVVKCEVCGEELLHTTVEEKALGHDWAPWRTVKEASETEEGLEERVCRHDPGHKETRKIPVIGHEHKMTHVGAKEATCTLDGNTEHWICSECGLCFGDEAGNKQLNKEDTVIPAKGHTPGEPVVENVTEPTCVTPGSHDNVIYCEVCKEEISRVTITDPVVPHKPVHVEGETKEPTCEEDGYHAFMEKCEVCGEVVSGGMAYVNALGHDFGEPTYKWKEDYSEVTATRVCKRDNSHVETETVKTVKTGTDPTCDEEGDYTYVATFENPAFSRQSQHERVAALGHDWNDWQLVKSPTETEPGTEERNCLRCDARQTRSVPPIGHEHKPVRIAEKKPTCTEDGNSEYYICAVCGLCFEDLAGTKEILKEDTIIPATGHTPGAAVKVNVTLPTCDKPGSHEDVVSCEVCGEELMHTTVIDKALGHDWGAWTVLKEPTETEEGLEERICRRDPEHKQTRSIPVADHEHSLRHVPAKDATCTEDGNKEYWICEGDASCGRYYIDSKGTEEVNEEDVIIPAPGHTQGEIKTENEVKPTCDKPGSHDNVAYCDVCGDEIWRITVTDNALGHKPVHKAGEIKEPTCEEDGYYTFTEVCEICGEVVGGETEYVNALGHDWGEWVVTKAPTETEEGLEERNCLRCDKHETRPVPVAGHEHRLTHVEAKAATCTEAGNIEYWICSEGDTACGRYFKDAEGKEEINAEDVVVAALGHDWNDWQVVKAPTETEEGLEERSCSRCGERETRSVPAIGHEHRLTHVEAKAATCTEAGNIEYWICSEGDTACGKYFKDAEGKEEINAENVVLAALGHDWGEWVVTKEPTETEEGIEERNCLRCGERETRAIPATGHEHRLTHVEAKAATCTEAGNIEYWTCSEGDTACGKYFKDAEGKEEINAEDVVLAALGHDWGEWVVTKEPTETEEGLEERSCSRCGERETRAIPKLSPKPIDNNPDGNDDNNKDQTPQGEDDKNKDKTPQGEDDKNKDKTPNGDVGNNAGRNADSGRKSGTVTGGTQTAAGKTTSGAVTKASPTTGDSNKTPLYILIAAGAAAGAVIAIVTRRKKRG